MRRNHTPDLIVGRRSSVTSLALLLAGALIALDATALDLGDLNVPPTRLRHPDGTPRWYQPFAIPDTSDWTRVNVDDYMQGCSRADDGTDDEPCIARAVAAATAVQGGVELFFPGNATYNIQGNQSIEIGRSDFVVRCEDPRTTAIQWHGGGTSQCGRNDGGYYQSALAGFCGDQRFSHQVSWIGGYKRDERILEVSSASNYNVGDWVAAWADTPPACFEGRWESPVYRGMMHLARVIGVNRQSNPNTITIDRPLRMDYDEDPDCSPHHIAKPAEMVENVGIENCTLRHASRSSTTASFKSLWVFYMTSNAWALGNRFTDHYNRGVTITMSRDTLIEGNEFSNIGYVNSNTGTAHPAWGATDTFIVNNSFISTRTATYLTNGSEGTVIAYNYTDGDQRCERSHFLHGRYTREVLLEGNDGDCAIQLDTFWGRQGPGTVLYRNRHRPANESRDFPRSLWSPSTHKDEPAFVTDMMTLIANIGSWFMQGPNFPRTPRDAQAYDIDRYTTNMWLELNVASERIGLQAPQPTTRCGTGSSGDCSISGNYRGRNYAGGNSAPSPAWDGIQIPDSLFLTEAPDWWCQEACDFAANTGIGALGDDMGATLCKLPAQIRYEGGTCTPLGSPPASTPPAAPFLLE